MTSVSGTTTHLKADGLSVGRKLVWKNLPPFSISTPKIQETQSSPSMIILGLIAISRSSLGRHRTINQDGIYGTLQDIVRLATLIRERVGSCNPGDSFALAQAFSTTSSTEFTLVCEPESFSPGAYDFQLYN
jgi:hypothetical protein